MPLPTKHKNEEQGKFMARCMSSGVMKSEFPENKQRLAVCFSQYRRQPAKK